MFTFILNSENFMKTPKKLSDLFIIKLNTLYDIEHVLVKALPTIAKATTNKELRDGLVIHAEETKEQIRRLEGIYKMIGVKTSKLKSEGIRGIVEDCTWVINAIPLKDARDAHLVRALQYAEHYEIAGYIGAIAWAHTLGEIDIAAMLNETLQEEKAADEKLASIGVTLDENVL
jgi:ferritin-like metal-binding protein YciE